ncbi:MAG: hypothetical protein K8J08_20085 [Thermoanaerobaculia bacterium]|nr:hypothetical protein [Thermoanaerobaculia bacterium]
MDSSWVDWAVRMLMEDHDSQSLAVLAGEGEPFNQFEMHELVGRVLTELDVQAPATRAEALSRVVEYDVRALAEGVGWPAAILPRLAQVCFENDYVDSLYGFYLLNSAYSELRLELVQRYWPGATRENIDEVIVEYSTKWLLEHEGDS